MERKPKTILYSPEGVAANCYLHKPDTDGDYANNKFKATVKWSKEDPPEGFEEFRAQLDDLYEKSNPKGTGARELIKDGDEKKKQDGTPNEDFAGYWFMVFQSIHRPEQIGKGNKRLPESLWILSGDVIKVKISTMNWGPKGANQGMSVFLEAVKLMQKRNSDYDAANTYTGWDDEDGFDPADSPFGGSSAGPSAVMSDGTTAHIRRYGKSDLDDTGADDADEGSVPV